MDCCSGADTNFTTAKPTTAALLLPCAAQVLATPVAPQQEIPLAAHSLCSVRYRRASSKGVTSANTDKTTK